MPVKDGCRYHFAICEDDKIFLEYLKTELQEAFADAANGESFLIDTYSDSCTLLERIQAGESYDALFLDIVMPDISGFELCRRIRSWESGVLIIFVSSKEELVFQSFDVQPFYFLRKNHLDQESGTVTREVMEKLRLNNMDKISLQGVNGSVLFTVSIRDTMYAEAQLRFCRFKMVVGEQSVKLPFREIIRQLEPAGFIRVHRSYLVNYRFIRRIEGQDVELDDGNRIPISRGRTGEVKMAYMQWSRR